MEKSLIVSIILAFLLFFSLLPAWSTGSVEINITVNEICLAALNDTNTLILNISPPVLSGGAPTGATDSSRRLQYTSVVVPGRTRSVTVNWDIADAAPAGTSLKVEPTSIPINCGSSGGQKTISATSQTLISGIGGCATGTGVNGVVLSYTYSIDNIALLNETDDRSVTITFTLTDSS